MKETVGVLLMAYGTPSSLEGIPAYLAHIRGGREPSGEMVADLRKRYEIIGGASPLTEITQAQAQELSRQLPDGSEWRVYVGMRHAPPFISKAVGRMLADGVKRAVAVSMTPHASAMSTGPYEEAARRALTEVGNPFPMSFVSGWHLHPGFISLLANRVHKALAQLPGQSPQMVLFTAHSLPVRITQTGDPYLSHLQETCQAVAEEALLNTYRLAFQSASRTPEPWLGPSASEALVKLHSEGIREVVVCPVGFVSDHLEILYDIDCKLREQAASLSVDIQRTQSLNADPDFIAVLADVVQKTVPCD